MITRRRFFGLAAAAPLAPTVPAIPARAGRPRDAAVDAKARTIEIVIEDIRRGGAVAHALSRKFDRPGVSMAPGRFRAGGGGDERPRHDRR